MEVTDLLKHRNVSMNMDNDRLGVYSMSSMETTSKYNASFEANQSTIPEYPSLLMTSPAAIVVPIIFILIFVIGLVGNCTLVYTVARNKNLQNTPNILIVSLATGDLLLILVSVPFTATYFTFNYWPYGDVICKLNEFMQTLSLGVSVFTLVALSGDRYMAIVFPMSKHKGSPKLRITIIASGIWIVAGLLAIMDAVKAHIEISTEGDIITEICQVQDGEYAKFRVLFRLFIYFIIPVIAIATLYSLMARMLFQSSRNMPGDSSSCNQVSRQLEARKKVAKVVLSFVLVFIVCWFPLYLYRIWYYFLPGDFNMFWYVFKFVSFCMAFANSCVNPFALYFISKQFRKYYNRYLFCCLSDEGRSERSADTYQTTLYHFNNANSRPSTSVTVMTKTAC